MFSTLCGILEFDKNSNSYEFMSRSQKYYFFLRCALIFGMMSLTGCQWTFPLEGDAGIDTAADSDRDTDTNIVVDTVYRIVPVSDTSSSLGMRSVDDHSDVSALDDTSSNPSKMSWTLKSADGYYEILPDRNSELNLRLHATGTEDFADVQLRTSVSSSPAQLWKIEHLGSGHYKLTSKEAWLAQKDAVLTACPIDTCSPINEVHPDAVIQSWHGGDNQKWMFWFW